MTQDIEKAERNPTIAITKEMRQQYALWAEALNLSSPSEAARLFHQLFEHEFTMWIRNQFKVRVDEVEDEDEGSE